MQMRQSAESSSLKTELKAQNGNTNLTEPHFLRILSTRSYELIAIDYRGYLRSFLVSPTEGFREHHTFNFSSCYRNGISAVSLLQPGNLLLLAGPSDVQQEKKGSGSSAGISAWRVMSDHPYYVPALSSEEDLVNIQASRGIWGWLPSLRSSQQACFSYFQ